MFKNALFVLMLAGCAKHLAPEASTTAGLYGFAGENFSSTNSPCLDGVIVAMDSSCAVPMTMEEGPPYVFLQCPQVRDDAMPWHKYTIVAITDPTVIDPPLSTMMCMDPYARLYIQKNP
jgi:hypothetical protein